MKATRVSKTRVSKTRVSKARASKARVVFAQEDEEVMSAHNTHASDGGRELPCSVVGPSNRQVIASVADRLCAESVIPAELGSGTTPMASRERLQRAIRALHEAEHAGLLVAAGYGRRACGRLHDHDHDHDHAKRGSSAEERADSSVTRPGRVYRPRWIREANAVNAVRARLIAMERAENPQVPTPAVETSAPEGRSPAPFVGHDDACEPARSTEGVSASIACIGRAAPCRLGNGQGDQSAACSDGDRTSAHDLQRPMLGLRCGAVHEICGICHDAEAVAEVEGRSAHRDDPRVAIPAIDGVLQMLRSMLSSNTRLTAYSNDSAFGNPAVDRIEDSIRASPPPSHAHTHAHVPAHGAVHVRSVGVELIERGVLWIGDRILPDAHCLAAAGFELIARHSILVRDTVDSAGHFRQSSPRDHRHGRRIDTGFDSDRGSGVEPGVARRVWCAEQALRCGAAGIIVVDGRGFHALAWRRLQRAVAQVARTLSEEAFGGPTCAAHGRRDTWDDSDGRAPAPIVLVLTPPSGQGGLAPRGFVAETRWTVRPRLGTPDVDSSLPASTAAGFNWCMTLESTRTLEHAIPGSCERHRSLLRAALEAGGVALHVGRVRGWQGGTRGGDAWRKVEQAALHAASVAGASGEGAYADGSWGDVMSEQGARHALSA
ncbi:MAG: hypothetical protein RL136_344 [Planctomycetota bacterium]